jgi:hypothetical protein
MALSDQLSALAARAKEAEDHAAAAKQKAKDDLQEDVEVAHASAAARGDMLRKKAKDKQDAAAAGWDKVQRSWNKHLAAARTDLDNRKEVHDLKSAQRAADRAQDNAVWAVDYALAAVDEADYAVQSAILAQMDADARAGK